MYTKLLSLNQVSKTINSGGNKITLLDKIDLQVNEGEFISLMGPSGSGKSTLLNCIGMLDSFTGGGYTFLGEPVHSMKEKNRTKLYELADTPKSGLSLNREQSCHPCKKKRPLFAGRGVEKVSKEF